MAVESVLLKISCDDWLVVFGVLVATLLRATTMLHPYSGAGRAPMYGDYEAQRHWMEITTNLPVTQWYRNGSDNDLNYWGLDYPPLTAYHMFLCGKIAEALNVNYTKLHDSRGYESEDHKWFMRLTVFWTDILLYIPALVIYFYASDKWCKSSDAYPVSLSIVLGLLYPGVILIDHGHFQYNNVSLGLVTLAVVFLICQKKVLASISFCCALNYKQMELYHSLPFFFYLLSSCVPKPGQRAIVGVFSLVKLGVTVVVTFALVWSPFLFYLDDGVQVLRRLFPFGRGIFEDKVSNVWCVVNVFYKLKSCNEDKLMRMCLFATLTAVLPSTVDLFLRPNLKKFPLALINSSLAFFLFSYQVHEKTILVAALPVLLYSPKDSFVSFWFLFVSVFSMFPLFVKDDLVVAVVGLTSFYVTSFYCCVKHCYQLRGKTIRCEKLEFIEDFSNSKWKKIFKNRGSLKNLTFFLIFFSSLISATLIAIISLVLEPPSRYPDLFPLIISAYSCFHFIGFLVYFNVKQLQISQDFGDIGNVKVKDD